MKNISIISDFSKTLTRWDNWTTWSLLAESWILWLEYNLKREELYSQYHKYELLWDKNKTREWFEKHLNLIVNSWITKDKIITLFQKWEYIQERKWLQNLMEYINNHSIKVIIITSWITDFVEEFFNSLWIDRTNIEIFWNKLVFNNKWECINYDKESIFCPLDNKSIFEKNFTIPFENTCILLWDKKDDLLAYLDSDISIWFCKNKQWYDYDLWKDGDLTEVINILEKI